MPTNTPKTHKKTRQLSESTKKQVAGSQKYRCANSPQSNAVPGIQCDRWVNDGGSFNRSGYDIDHIVEVADGGTDAIDNLQALCPSCHRVKSTASMAARAKRKREGVAVVTISDESYEDRKLKKLKLADANKGPPVVARCHRV